MIVRSWCRSMYRKFAAHLNRLSSSGMLQQNEQVKWIDLRLLRMPVHNDLAGNRSFFFFFLFSICKFIKVLKSAKYTEKLHLKNYYYMRLVLWIVVLQTIIMLAHWIHIAHCRQRIHTHTQHTYIPVRIQFMFQLILCKFMTMWCFSNGS